MPPVDTVLDLYATLGVDTSTNKREMHSAYHRLVIKWLGDENRRSKDGKKKIKLIKEAWAVLGHDDTKEEYDNMHKHSAKKIRVLIRKAQAAATEDRQAKAKAAEEAAREAAREKEKKLSKKTRRECAHNDGSQVKVGLPNCSDCHAKARDVGMSDSRVWECEFCGKVGPIRCDICNERLRSLAWQCNLCREVACKSCAVIHDAFDRGGSIVGWVDRYGSNELQSSP